MFPAKSHIDKTYSYSACTFVTCRHVIVLLSLAGSCHCGDCLTLRNELVLATPQLRFPGQLTVLLEPVEKGLIPCIRRLGYLTDESLTAEWL